MRLLTAALAAAAALSCGAAQAQSDRPGDFDFYVLSLSWSPSYCAAKGSRADPVQCGSAAPRGFVVHGLWPQYERGFPGFCAVTGRNPTRAQVDGMLDLMPSPGLIRHQWRKHGTCSGLDPSSYFRQVRRAAEHVRVPPAFAAPDSPIETSPAAVEEAFVAANPSLRPSMIAVQCRGRLLNEVRVCMTKDLRFRPCAEVDRRACRSDRVVLPASGGDEG
ncbi:ribonuclease T2 family protein [Hansschlegelia beijingensis]|uniref:Ribonuclease T2 n=1 Tax=Hansschlegelia beijingensis TaxID=1133344 RepID=A0A7W6CZE9_9HYPH|nr:ribonuclease T2 [Hansschlegelia beijingensis]MBB3971580.1 ribonuclease T2 [Hansschlegelia beijingensis]